MKQINYIVREVSPESADLSFYFDGDCYNERSGDYCNTLFIICSDRGRIWGLNDEEYKNVMQRASDLAEDFRYVADGVYDYNGKRITYKSVMGDYCIPYNPTKCHRLKEWAKDADERDTDCIAEFLTIITGKEWATDSAHGYCQGDYVEMVYCEDVYKDGVKAEGEIWLGAAKEFCVIEIENYTEAEDEDDEPSYTEGDTCYGYIVADCQAWKDEDYKRLVCEWACIPEDETRLEMIDSWHTYTSYSYRAV